MFDTSKKKQIYGQYEYYQNLSRKIIMFSTEQLTLKSLAVLKYMVNVAHKISEKEYSVSVETLEYFLLL